MSVWLKRLPSEATRVNYGEYLNQFLEFCGISASETLKWDVEKAEDEMEAFKVHLKNKGLAGGTIKLAWQGVKKWFRDNRIKVDKECSGVDTGKTYLDYIPVKSDVKHLLSVCKLEYKVAASLLAFSGIRPVDIRNLKYKHLKKSYEDGEEVLTLTLKQRKTKKWYVTFLGPQGKALIRALLEKRRVNGEKITDETYIVSKNGKQMKEDTLKLYLKEAIKRSVGRHPTREPFRVFRPYGLRKYFRREVRKYMSENEAEFLMGHVEGIRALSAVYSGLADLDPEAIQNLKQRYLEAIPDLETEISEMIVTSELESLRKRVQELEAANRRLLGLETKEEMDKFGEFMKQLYKEQKERWYREDREAIKREEEFRAEISDKIFPEQLVIKEGELETYLGKGWLFKAALNNGTGKVIIERTGSA